MDKEKFNFQIDLEGEETPSIGRFGEGYGRPRIFVEVSPEAYGESLESDLINETAEEIARMTAQELADQELAELRDDGENITALQEFPPVIQDLEPDVQEPGVRAWFLNG